VARYLSPGGQQFRGDRGAADPRVAAALAAYLAGEGSEQQALTALAEARLLVPVLATATETSDSEMAMPTLIGHDGRHAILAFTGTDTLARWREEARPVPAESSRVWRAAVADGCAVVIDVAGPVPIAVEGTRLAALAAGQPVPAAYEDGDVLAEVEAAIATEPVVAGVSMAPSHQVDLAVRLHLSADSWAGGDWQPAVNHVAQSIAARLAGRLRRGVEVSVTRDPLGS
jgi:SseB protein N-terminal domain